MMRFIYGNKWDLCAILRDPLLYKDLKTECYFSYEHQAYTSSIRYTITIFG